MRMDDESRTVRMDGERTARTDAEQDDESRTVRMDGKRTARTDVEQDDEIGR